MWTGIAGLLRGCPGHRAGVSQCSVQRREAQEVPSGATEGVTASKEETKSKQLKKKESGAFYMWGKESEHRTSPLGG